MISVDQEVISAQQHSSTKAQAAGTSRPRPSHPKTPSYHRIRYHDFTTATTSNYQKVGVASSSSSYLSSHWPIQVCISHISAYESHV